MIHWNQLWTWKMKWNTKAIQNWMHSERVKSSYKCDNFICIFFPPFAVQKRNSLGCKIQFRRIKTDSMQRFIQFSYTCGLVRSMPRQAYIHLPFVHSTVLIRCVLFHGTFIEIMTLSLNHRLNVQLKSIRYTQKKTEKTHTPLRHKCFCVYNLQCKRIHNSQVCWFACFFSIPWSAFVCFVLMLLLFNVPADPIVLVLAFAFAYSK